MKLIYNWELEKYKLLLNEKWLTQMCTLFGHDMEHTKAFVRVFFSDLEHRNAMPKFPKEIKPRFIAYMHNVNEKKKVKEN